MKKKFVFFAFIFFFLNAWSVSGQLALRFVMDSIDCSSNQVFYQLQIRSDGTDWKLGSQNYRLFYDSEHSAFNIGQSKSLLGQNDFGEIQLKSHVRDIDARSIGGQLSFEEHLGFINFSIEAQLDISSTIVGSQWIPVANLCFDFGAELFQSEHFMSLVFARQGKTSEYAKAYINISAFELDNHPFLARGESFEDVGMGNDELAYFGPYCQNETIEYVHVGGKITRVDGSPFESLLVVAAGYNGYDNLTSTVGTYAFDLALDYPYFVMPFKNDNILQGVDEADFNLLMQFLAGEAVFTGLYQYLAADINADGQIDLSDASELFSVLAGTHQKFPNNSSYIFVDKGFEFPHPMILRPHEVAYPSRAVYKPLKEAEYNLDFVGIKVGDITGADCSGCPVLHQFVSSSSRSVDKDQSYNVFPNPVRSNLSIVPNHVGPKNMSLAIQAVDGRLVLEFDQSGMEAGETVQLDVSNLVDGIYFLSIQAGEHTTTQKIVIQK